MDYKTIQSQFGKDCECENDVIKNCKIKIDELINALDILGIDTSRSENLKYIRMYLLLKLKDIKYEKQNLELEKLRLGMN